MTAANSYFRLILLTSETFTNKMVDNNWIIFPELVEVNLPAQWNKASREKEEEIKLLYFAVEPTIFVVH